MLVLGLTGGIGSGKTTVAKIFQSFGVPVYNSDERAKAILFSDKEVHRELKSAFGEAIFIDNTPDKVKLAQLVFSDKTKLAGLNKTLHPRVAEDFENWKHTQSAEIVVKEAAILIESGAYRAVDKIVVVTAPVEVRINRVLKRDNSSEEEVKNRIEHQFSEEERLEYADFIIDNSGEDHLISQVEKIINSLM